jgi:hypothetical protein
MVVLLPWSIEFSLFRSSNRYAKFVKMNGHNTFENSNSYVRFEALHGE